MAEAPSPAVPSTLGSVGTQPTPPAPSPANEPGAPAPLDLSSPAFDPVRTLIGGRGSRASARTEEILRAMAAALAQLQGQQPPQPSHTATTTIPPPPRSTSPPLSPPREDAGNDGHDNDNANGTATGNAVGAGAGTGTGTGTGPGIGTNTHPRVLANDGSGNDSTIGDDGCGFFFNEDRDADEFDELLIPALVRHRHENQQIWPYWLVSIEGQRALRAMQRATTDLSLLSDKNTSLPPGVVPDADLTYTQFRDGVQFFPNLLRFSNRTVWPERFQLAWGEFYADLDSHPVKRAHLGERAIVIYANQVRMRFHAEVAAPSASWDLTPLKVSGARLREIRLGLELEETQKVRFLLYFHAPLHCSLHGFYLRHLAAFRTCLPCFFPSLPICARRIQRLTLILVHYTANPWSRSALYITAIHG